MKYLLPIVLGMVVGCETTTVVTREQDQPKPRATEMPTVSQTGEPLPAKRVLIKRVRFERTGGFAGTTLTIDITPAGAWRRIEGRPNSQTESTGQMSQGQLHKLAEAFWDFDRYKSEYLPRDGTADDFKCSIRYGDKTVTGSDASPDVPESFLKLCRTLMDSADSR